MNKILKKTFFKMKNQKILSFLQLFRSSLDNKLWFKLYVYMIYIKVFKTYLLKKSV